MKILYTKKQADEIINTLKEMEKHGVNMDYINTVKEVVRHGYKGAKIYFYNRLYQEVPEMAKYFKEGD